MNTEVYEYATNADNLIYMFYSSGKKGIIPKIIIYEKIANNHYNLAFGDYDRLQKALNDLSVTNNGDTIKVLGTVIDTIKQFFLTYPYALLEIRGSTQIRTKLYQKIIRDNWINIETDFRVLAFKDEEDKPKIPNFTQEYDFFQVSKK